MFSWRKWLAISILALLFLYVGMPLIGRVFQPSVTVTPATGDRELVMVELLSKDAIPSIDYPQFVTGADADAQYGDEELVIGLEVDGDARAYSIPFLSGHEIVNDVVGDQPVAVTW